jgi:GTP-binding protein HflX
MEPGAIFASAHTGEGIDALLARIDEVLPRPHIPLTVVIPFDRGDVVARLHDAAIVESTTYEEGGTVMKVVIDEHLCGLVEPFIAAR